MTWLLVIVIQSLVPNTPIQTLTVPTPSQAACQTAGEQAKKGFQALRVEYVCMDWPTAVTAK